ncbi:hypothetical protein PARPLA_02415 [Rhodobacteraceae bacterium THAF1]|uniref:DUF2155 domain-containing protein n=1 Tax=Palleronia sp. THAF1 TaxID=2587842 RepID=UPI000F3CE2E1|nr:DUF2155 domain-containing protein [Palleronia sp. THAF1]QFU09225.1 hypothetical protein FIU81_11125 [Palleronia sp. THAF1]VDC27351.1 hypothetical protein PARPLA_02415 [Rhodobacteraceae bacterium THAF1]
MMRLTLALALIAAPAFAQDDGVIEIPGAGELFQDNGDIMQQDIENGILIPLNDDVTEEVRDRVAPGRAVILRKLDKLTGDVQDIELGAGQSATVGRLQVSLSECRYPETNPAGNAYAHLVIREQGADATIFSGWMIAQAPALNALEHPRYDVWVMRCIV